MSDVITMTFEEWMKKGEELFGEDKKNWRFKCPACGNTQTIAEFIKLGLDKDKILGIFYYSCIGRWDKTQGCDYTTGGLFNISPIKIIKDGQESYAFAFAEEENKVKSTKFLG